LTVVPATSRDAVGVHVVPVNFSAKSLVSVATQNVVDVHDSPVMVAPVLSSTCADPHEAPFHT
jgi:hypothetical protein